MIFLYSLSVLDVIFKIVWFLVSKVKRFIMLFLMVVNMVNEFLR